MVKVTVPPQSPSFDAAVIVAVNVAVVTPVVVEPVVAGVRLTLVVGAEVRVRVPVPVVPVAQFAGLAV